MATAVRDADALDLIDLCQCRGASQKEWDVVFRPAYAASANFRAPSPGPGKVVFGASLPTPRNQSGCADRWPYLIHEPRRPFDVFVANSRWSGQSQTAARTIFACGCIFADLNPRARGESCSPVTATL